MTFESILGYVLSFVLGAMVALFWAYTGHGARLTSLEGGRIGKVDLSAMQAEITYLTSTIQSMDFVDLAANVRVMRESVIFQSGFQSQLIAVCSEHKDMHDTINVNTNRLTALETKVKIKSNE